jgi:hypothetical protein
MANIEWRMAKGFSQSAIRLSLSSSFHNPSFAFRPFLNRVEVVARDVVGFTDLEEGRT